MLFLCAHIASQGDIAHMTGTCTYRKYPGALHFFTSDIGFLGGLKGMGMGGVAFIRGGGGGH